MFKTYLKQHTITIFIVLAAIQAVFNNLVHPVTPAFIQNLNLNDYMFGVAYASMNTALFIFSFYWADASNKMKMDKIFLISLLGYAMGQLFFMLSTTQLQIMLARLLAGGFSGGFIVGQMTFLVNQSTTQERGENLTKYTVSIIVASTFGYLVGGVIGDYSILLTFLCQVIGLVILAFTTSMFLRVTQNEVIIKETKNISPIHSFRHSLSILDNLGKLIFFSILCVWLANTAFDNSFNYYLRDVLKYPPSVNGILKAVIGVFTLISNLTLTFYIIKRTKVSRSMMWITLFASLLIFMILFNRHNIAFIILSLFVLACFSILQPLQQQVVSLLSNDQASINHLMGLYSAMKALGGILGALTAGFVYEIHSRGPFLLAFVFIFMAFMGLLRHERKSA